MKVLVAIDGSKFSLRGLEYVVTHADVFGVTPEITLINVHPPVPSPRAAAWVGKDVVEKYYAEEADEALKGAREILGNVELVASEIRRVGDPGHEIAKAGASGYQMIVMGTHGRTGLKNLVMGSVATRTIAESSVPVLLVK
jgi:nucleotide-binding universal stress UspA family protein